MRGRSYDVTTRDVSSTRYWVILAGYVAVLPLIILISIYSAFSSGSGAFAYVYPLSVVLFVALVGAPIALFKDAIYLREVKANWRPQWWRYFGGVFGLPFIGGMSTGVIGLEEGGFVIGAMIFIVTMWVGAAHYIYRRHKTIGVP